MFDVHAADPFAIGMIVSLGVSGLVRTCLPSDAFIRGHVVASVV